jgi:hypothetical protein
MTKRWWVSLIAAAAVTGMTTGCHNKDNTTASTQRLHGENFRPDDEPREVDNVTFAQAAAGARADSTLYGSHFDTHGINSLGRAKLALMLRDEQPIDPLVVYIDLPSYMPAEPAHTSVSDFLKSRGLTEAQIELVDGANPRTLHAAAPTGAAMRSLSTLGAPGGGGVGAAYGATSPETAVPPAPAPAPAPTDATPH